MRIIKGRDYYDGAGHDVYTDIRFVRDRRELAGAPIDVPTVFERHRGQRRDDTLTFFALVVAGEVIPGAIHRAVPEPDRGADVRTIHYAREAVAALLATWSREVRWGYWRPWHASDADAFMARRGEGPWTRWLAEHQVVTGVIEGVRRRHTLPPTPVLATTLVANTDNLKDYEAYRALDPATAHMRIANWVGGVLPPDPARRGRGRDPRRPPLLTLPAAPGDEPGRQQGRSDGRRAPLGPPALRLDRGGGRRPPPPPRARPPDPRRAGLPLVRGHADGRSPGLARRGTLHRSRRLRRPPAPDPRLGLGSRDGRHPARLRGHDGRPPLSDPAAVLRRRRAM